MQTLEVVNEVGTMSKKHQKARKLIALGFHLFPSRSKKEHIKDWPNKASRDVKVIDGWWGPEGTHQDWDISIFTGKFGDDEALLVVDIDPRNGGHETVRRIVSENPGAFPDTRTHGTPSGGYHLIYKVKRAVQSGVHVLGRGIDIRSAGALIHFGEQYEVVEESVPIADAPQQLIDQCGAPREKKAPINGHGVPLEINQEQAKARAIRYLDHEAEPAIEGQGGDIQTLKVAEKVKDLGVSQHVATELMIERYNPRCSPPWSDEELATKVANAYKYGSKPIGCAAPEVQFPPVEEDPNEKKILSPVEEMNKTWALIVGSSAHYIRETEDAEGQPVIQHLSPADFNLTLKSKTIMVGTKTMSMATFWSESKDRREYNGITFRPGKDTVILSDNGQKYLNLWRGFAYSPAAPGSTHPAVDQWLEHAQKNICQHDPKLFDWLMGWCAHLIQKPWEKPHTAPVFFGGKGVGKNAFIEPVGALLGRHFFLTSNRRYLLGNFNGHLENCLLFVSDESFWAGDKQAEGMLKDLITGQKHVIEHKNVAPYQVPNLTRVVIMGNDPHLIPASPDERRYAVFEVGAGRRQDHTFFGAMVEGMRNGGYPVLLRYLLDYDLAMAEFLDGFNVNRAPLTAGLLRQKLESDDPLSQWWFDCLCSGRIVNSEFEGWPESIDCVGFRLTLERNLKSRSIHSRKPSDQAIGRKMRDLGVVRKNKRQKGGGFTQIYAVPSLQECRRRWDVEHGQTQEWDGE